MNLAKFRYLGALLIVTACAASHQDSCVVGSEAGRSVVNLATPISEPGIYLVSVETAHIHEVLTVTLGDALTMDLNSLECWVEAVPSVSPPQIGSVVVPGEPEWISVAITQNGVAIRAGTVYPTYTDLYSSREGCPSERRGEALLK